VSDVTVETRGWTPAPMSERVVVRCYSSFGGMRATVSHRPPPPSAAGWSCVRSARSTRRECLAPAQPPETGHVDVDQYEVLVEVDHADRARELLAD
jgi:hypothetical protein